MRIFFFIIFFLQKKSSDDMKDLALALPDTINIL